MDVVKNSKAIVSALVMSTGITLAGPVAAQTLDFAINAPSSGTISFAGNMGDALVGTDISVDTVIGLDTPLNANLDLNCTGCLLNFTTGGYAGTTSNEWLFAGDGNITLTGGLDLDFDNVLDVPISTPLLSGSFTEASTVQLEAGELVFQIAAGAFTDKKNGHLLDFYGMPSGVYNGGMNISFTPVDRNQTIGTAFESDTIFSGNVVNTPVPLPSAAWLLISGLAGFTWLGRRNRST